MPDDYKIRSIATFENTTVVFAHGRRDPGDLKMPEPCEVAFQDANNNRKLDPGDRKVGEYFEIPHNSTGRRIYIGGEAGPRAGFLVSSVSKKDIEQWGNEIDSYFNDGQNQRNKIKEVPVLANGITEGICGFIDYSPDDIAHYGAQERQFSPPLSLNTIRTDKTTIYKANKEVPDPADPLKCGWASAKIAPDVSEAIMTDYPAGVHDPESAPYRFQMSGSITTDSYESPGNYYEPPGDYDFLKALGLRDDRRRVNVSYYWSRYDGGVYFRADHLDFSK